YPEPRSKAYSNPAAWSIGDTSATPLNATVTGLPSTPSVVTANAAAVGATLCTLTPIVFAAEAVDPFDCSVARPLTVRGNGASPGRLSGRVIVSPASWAALSVQLPSALSVPAERVPPAGTPATVIASTSDPSVSTSAAAMPSGIATFSSPE